MSVSGVFGRFLAEGVGPLNERPNKGNWARLGQRSDGKKSREGACRSMCWHHSGCTCGGNRSRSSELTLNRLKPCRHQGARKIQHRSNTVA